MPYLIENKNLLKACNKMWSKITNIMKKGVEIEPV